MATGSKVKPPFEIRISCELPGEKRPECVRRRLFEYVLCVAYIWKHND